MQLPIPFVLPIAPFSPRDGYFADRHGKLHSGLDLASNCFNDVHAIAPGVVVSCGISGSGKVCNYKGSGASKTGCVGQSDTAGNFVIIKHTGAQYDGLDSRYLHLSHVYVSKGDLIEADQVIGTSGHTGNSVAPHLHMNIAATKELLPFLRKKGLYIYNPTPLPVTATYALPVEQFLPEAAAAYEGPDRGRMKWLAMGTSRSGDGGALALLGAALLLFV